MPIAGTDLVFRYTTTAGAAGDSTAGSAAGSLGKYISTTVWPGGDLSLFDAVSAAENTAQESEYRGVAILNNNATISAFNVGVYMAEVAGGTNVAIGVDPTTAKAKNSATAGGVTIVNEDTAPAGVTFTSPTTAGTALSLGTLAPGEYRVVWVRRTTTNSASIDADGFTLFAVGE